MKNLTLTFNHVTLKSIYIINSLGATSKQDLYLFFPLFLTVLNGNKSSCTMFLPKLNYNTFKQMCFNIDSNHNPNTIWLWILFLTYCVKGLWFTWNVCLLTISELAIPMYEEYSRGRPLLNSTSSSIAICRALGTIYNGTSRENELITSLQFIY